MRSMSERLATWVHQKNPDVDLRRIEERMEPELAEQIYLLDRCIECGCCVAACGTARMREDFRRRGRPQPDRALPARPARHARRRRLLRADRRRPGGVRLHVSPGLPRPVPEGSAAPDSDRVHATEDDHPRLQVREDRPMAHRIEKDFLGEKQVPADAYYGVQTVRGMENFHITGMPMSREPYFVKAFGYVKKAAAMANRDLGVLDKKIAEAIIKACDRVIAGDMNDQFVTDFIQGGAGTSTNMNANEVIANLALESSATRRASTSTSTPTTT
jgi:ferredoxin